MAKNSDFIPMRIGAFRNWCATATVPNISRENFTGIFQYVLSQQTSAGAWAGDNVWETVMTAVVLKSLAALKFRPGDRWSFNVNGQIMFGSIDASLRYLGDQLKGKYTDEVGEGIWDPCQALLAVAAFGQQRLGLKHAQRIAREWKDLYKRACDSESRWTGPAYLAAMIDVLLCYSHDLDGSFDIQQLYEALISCEQKADEKPSGSFQAIGSDLNVNRWTTGLVLRTLCALPQRDVALIERCATWLLGQFKEKHWQADIREAPMFMARCLDGISRARNFVSSDLRARIDDEIASSNKMLMSFWNEDAEFRRGSLKAYTAVGEYLASICISVPAGLVFDLATTGVDEAAVGARVTTASGGIFIVHGHDMSAVRELQHYIQNVLGLSNPIILRDRASGGETVVEKFEREAAEVALVFILLTPDDIGNLETSPTAPAHRARQNVIFELGYFFGRFGRTSGRLILLSRGDVELPSDIAGVIDIDISDGIEAAGEEIRREAGPILDELRALQRANRQ